MKKSVFIIVILLSVANLLHAQIPVIIKNNQTMPFDKQVKVGDSVTFKLHNVNTFYYDVIIDVTSTTYDYGNPAEAFNSKLFPEGADGGNLIKVEDESFNKSINKADEWLTKSVPESFLNIYELVMKEVSLMRQLDVLDSALRGLVMTKNPLDYGNMEVRRDQTVEGILGVNYKEAGDFYSFLYSRYSNTYSRLEKYLTDLYVGYAELSNSQKVIVTPIKNIADTLSNTLDKSKFIAKLESVTKLYNDIREDAFCVSKIILIQRNVDEIKIVYTIKEKNDNDPEILKKDSITIMVSKRFNLNISTGGFITGLNDFEYTTTNVNADGEIVQQIAQKNSGKAEFATGVLAHVYMNFKPNFSPALSIGVAVNGDNEMRYLAGLSTIFGRKQRFVISGGAAAGKTDRLSEHQDIGQDVTSSDEVQIISPIKTSWFVSFTYNF